jgi:hypothetical protein
MSELQTYYDEFCRPGAWAREEAEDCGCRGSGWWLSELDTWHECPCHYEKGQPHPEDEPEAHEAWEARKAMLASGWVAPVVVEGPPRMKVGERFGVPVYADSFEDDDIPF